MFKTILFLACIVLMGSGIKNVYNQTQGGNLRSFISSSKPSEVDSQSGNFNVPSSIETEVISEDNTTSSYSFIETETGQFNSKTISRDVYVCPAGYNYLSYNDQLRNIANLCNKIANDGTYRLEGGGSVDGPGSKCTSSSKDPSSLGKAFCAKTTVQQKIKAVSENCPPGYDRASVDEVTTNTQAFCDLLGASEVARIGLRGSISRKGSGCVVTEWQDEPLAYSACVQRNLDDVKVLQQNEDICGKGRTLMTTEEALTNKKGVCYQLPAWGIGRLAGGASMDGPSYGCKVRYVDKRTLGHALCGLANR